MNGTKECVDKMANSSLFELIYLYLRHFNVIFVA